MTLRLKYKRAPRGIHYTQLQLLYWFVNYFFSDKGIDEEWIDAFKLIRAFGLFGFAGWSFALFFSHLMTNQHFWVKTTWNKIIAAVVNNSVSKLEVWQIGKSFVSVSSALFIIQKVNKYFSFTYRQSFQAAWQIG